MGEQELATEMDFSRVGRVNAMLARRLELLAEVQCHRLTKLLSGCAIYKLVATCKPNQHLQHALQNTEMKLFLVVHKLQQQVAGTALHTCLYVAMNIHA